MQRCVCIGEQALHDPKPQPGSLALFLGGEVVFENPGHYLRGDPVAIILHVNRNQGSFVHKDIPASKHMIVAVAHFLLRQGFVKLLGIELHAMRTIRALEGVHDQIDQYLDQIRTVDR